MSRPRVRAVRRYRAPGYPSHADPDPTRVPYPVPYPLAPRVASAVVAAGVAAGCGKPPRPAPASNPFTVADAGLPHVASMFGFGVPERLESERARRVILEVFEQEGFALRRNVRLREPGLDLLVDGYDDERGVGFVFADWERIGGDARESFGSDRAAAPEQLTMDEARELVRAADAGERFVALIAPYDPRFEYFRHVKPSWLFRFLGKHDLLTEGMRDWMVRRALEDATDEAFHVLEEHVRDYIAWARANGL